MKEQLSTQKFFYRTGAVFALFVVNVSNRSRTFGSYLPLVDEIKSDVHSVSLDFDLESFDRMNDVISIGRVSLPHFGVEKMQAAKVLWYKLPEGYTEIAKQEIIHTD